MAPNVASLGSPVVFARVLEAAREAGMGVASLRELHGHESWKERCGIWGRIMRAVKVDGFPIRVANRYSVGEIGPLGLVAQVAPDLRSALQRLIHHQHVLAGTALSRTRDDVAGRTTIVEFMPVEGSDLGGRCRREMMVASALKFARDVSGVWIRPRRVCFRHAEPRDLREHQGFFDCEIRFEAEYDGLEFDRDTLGIPLPGADADLSQFLVEHLCAVAGDPPPTAMLEERLRQAILGRLGNQTLAMGALAQELGMSTRTLRRRLLGQRTRYHDILDRVRRERADELLGEAADHKLAEIAFQLGFSDASAFHRAYGRWTGNTPASRRRRVVDA